jgi:CspA family cold shock protein
MGREIPSFPPFIIDKLRRMSDNEEIPSHLTNGGPNYASMDNAFCDRMCAAIAAGLESAPIGVITTPGTKNPKYVPTEPSPLASSLGGMDF